MPGIIASYLNNAATGEEIWPNFLKMETIWMDVYLNDLGLDYFGNRNNNNPIVSSTDIFKKIDDLDFFNGLIEELKVNGYEEGEDLFIFPYDWRKSIDKIAGQNPDFLMNNLDQEIFKIKIKTGADKVDVIAHSMGGLVVKDYINIYGDENINKFIDIATPHLGSPEAFKMLFFGENLDICKNIFGKNICILNEKTVKDISQNFPSIYQLLPSRKYFESGIPGILPTDGYIYDIVGGDQNVGILSGLTYDQSIDYLAYTKDEECKTRNQYLLGEFGVNAVNVNDELHSRLDNMPNSDDYYSIIGCGQATYAGIQKKGGESWALKPIDGDGTVPLKSALPFGAKKYYSTSTVHSQIPSVDGVRQLVVSILQGKEDDFDMSAYPGLSSSPSICGINGTQIGSLSPVELHIYDENGNHVGPTADGDIEIGIPGATYDALGEEKFAFLPVGHTYRVENRAISDGDMGIIIKRIENDEVVESVYFDSIDLASASTTVGYIVSDNQSSYSAQVDRDGDGVVDVSFVPDSVLNDQEEINDPIAPQTIADISGQLGENGYYVSDVALTLSANDDTDGSGILKTLYSLDDGLNWQEHENQIIVSSEGENKILYYSKDKAANSEEAKEIVVKIDKTAPQITPIAPQPNQEVLRNETLNVEYLVDDNYSGITDGQDELYLDGRIISSREVDLFRDKLGQHSLKISVKDLAGNRAEQIVDFYAVTSISGTIADVGRAYDEDLMNEKAKRALVDDLQKVQDYLDKNVQREERRDSVEQRIMDRCVQKKGQAWCEDKLGNVFEKIDYKLNEVQKRIIGVKYELILKKLELYEKIGWIEKVGGDIIGEDVEYLINNIK